MAKAYSRMLCTICMSGLSFVNLFDFVVWGYPLFSSLTFRTLSYRILYQAVNFMRWLCGLFTFAQLSRSRMISSPNALSRCPTNGPQLTLIRASGSKSVNHSIPGCGPRHPFRSASWRQRLEGRHHQKRHPVPGSGPLQ